jgi:hypothetical protein
MKGNKIQFCIPRGFQAYHMVIQTKNGNQISFEKKNNISNDRQDVTVKNKCLEIWID